jgi:nicotinamidase-related amidase
MREVYGKLIYDSLEELVMPSHTTLVVVDMQNDLVSHGGLADRNGTVLDGNRRVIEPLRLLLESARGAGVLITYVLYTIQSGLPTASPAWIYEGMRLFRGTDLSPAREGISSLEGLFEGTWGWEVIPELSPREGDILVRKHHLGAFWDTNLDKILRGNGIETVVVTGTATSGCVFDTAVGSAAHDYYTVFVRDCVTSVDSAPHELGIELLSRRYPGPMSDDLLKVWRRTEAQKKDLA